MSKTAPLIVEVTRGTMVESVHRVHAMVMDASGVVDCWGDPDLLFYPRSAIKFLQALPLIESGAADAYALSGPETALSAASHSSAPDHVATVKAWLDRIEMGEQDLRCGAHLPYDEHAAHAMLRAGEPPTRLHNNCSGKHSGFLSTAKHLGEPTEGYLDPDHPVQKRLYDILVDFGGEALDGTGRGIDGCGIPVYGMSLRAMTRAAQRMAAPHNVDEARGHAIERVLAAAMAHSYYVAGRARFDTDVMTALGGTVATKGGAEGVHLGIVPGRGIGIGLKTEDGNRRGGDVAMGWILDRLGLIDGSARDALREHLAPTIVNAAGDPAGTARVSSA